MPELFRASISPRYHECDPDGALHIASYLRIVLQMAIEAGAAADLKIAGLDVAGWLDHVGDIGVQISLPARFGDALEVRTRLTRLGPPVWRREFTFERAGSTLALAFVDVFDADDSQLDGGDDATPDAGATRVWDGPVADPPEPPGRAFRAVWRASWPQMDISGQLDPGYLTQMLVDMESRAAESMGWSAERDQEKGIAWRVVEHRLELFEAIQAGDVLNVTSYIGEVGDDQMVRHALVERQDHGLNLQVAQARTRWECLSTVTAERCAIPEDWIYDLTDQMADL